MKMNNMTNGDFMMMGNMSELVKDEQTFLEEAIPHHLGAIQMAEKIKTISKPPELLKPADEIITSQTKERTTLMNWLMQKYNDHRMMEI